MQSSLRLPDCEKSIKPKSYTSGGWLHQDKLQRAMRHIEFDFAELCMRARATCEGNPDIVDIWKIEGGFNRCFVIKMSNGIKVVARIPTKLAGPPRLTTRSEVATMQLVSVKTSIPVPRVLDWSDDPCGQVGSEYIIMEYVEATRLGEIWDEMDAVQRLKCTQNLSRIITELSSLEFEGYGCLTYNVHDEPIGALQYDSTYSIGPHCGSRYWKCGLGESELYGNELKNQGPWKDLSAFVRGQYETAILRVPLVTPSNTPAWKGSREEILRLLEQSYTVMQVMIQDPKIQLAAAAALSHPDFDMKNIFVSKEDPTTIVSVIDWQSASIEPAFMFASENPDFASIPLRTPLKLDAQRETEAQKELELSSICSQAYDAVLRLSSVKLQVARELSDSITRLFKLCPIAWTVGATAIRSELIRLNHGWSDLGFKGQCPYIPTDGELELHERLYEEFENAQIVKRMVMQMLGCNADGNVLRDQWEVAQDKFPVVLDWWIQSCKQNDNLTEEEARKLFPFDGR